MTPFMTSTVDYSFENLRYVCQKVINVSAEILGM